MPHTCHRFWKCRKTLTFCSLLTRCTILCARHTKQHLNLQKWREHVVFCTFSLRNVLRAATACTLSQLHSTSRSGPTMVCFVHFDFDMCFAPQLRALFRHHNFQKWSEHGVFCTFSLRNLLRTTSHHNGVHFFDIATSKCVSRHNGVHFFISHLASWLRTRRFSELTFRPSGASNHWKNTVFRDFPTFSRICIFFLLTLSLL